MQRERIRRYLAIAMIALGFVQVGLGVRSGNAPFAGLGAVYALIGVAWPRCSGRGHA